MIQLHMLRSLADLVVSLPNEVELLNVYVCDICHLSRYSPCTSSQSLALGEDSPRWRCRRLNSNNDKCKMS